MSDPLAELAALESCGCHACMAVTGEVQTFYVLCPDCGCKRCPKATNHVHSCSQSNDSGQFGSVYGEDCPDTCCAELNRSRAESRARFDVAIAEIGELDMAAFRKRHNLSKGDS
jgi:hypothetical protein